MKAIVSKTDIIAGIARTAGALPQRPTSIQSLQSILLSFSAEDGAIRSTATDLEVAVIVDTPATVQEGGALTVPGKKLLESIREMPDGEVTMVVSDRDSLTLKSGKTRLTLRGAGKDEYPPVPLSEGTQSIKVDAVTFQDAIRKTIVAASRDESRSFLTGANLIVNPKMTRLVATDGHRLAITDFSLSGQKKGALSTGSAGGASSKGSAVDVNVIIPARILSELGSNLPPDGEVDISIGETSVIFTTRFGTYYSRLIAEKFPDYEKIIPKSSSRKIELSRQELSDSLRRVSLFTNLRSHSVFVAVKSDRLILSTETPEFGEGQDEVEAKITGSAMEISFDARYLQDVLKVLSSEDVTIEMGEKLSPAVFSTSADKGYKYVLMPLRG